MGGKCGKVCGAAVGVAVLAVAVPLLRQYASLHAEQKFAFMTTHNATALPSNHASRYRGREYFRDDRFFFQWWNYIVFDAETRDHFNLIYQITEFSAKFAGGRNLSQAHTSMGHFKGSSFRSAGGESVPLADCSLQGDWGMHLHKDGGKGRRPLAAAADEFTNKALRDATTKPLARDTAEAVLQGIPYQQNVLDDDTYHLLATVPASKSLTGVPITWDLTFKRVHGVYTNADAEADSRGDMCMMLSTLWGYHSEVWGTITEGDTTYTITRTPRYRAYAAGSWGCTLPTGKPAVQYPWVWFWLIVPGPVPAQDLSFAWGGATMQSPGNAVGDIDGYFTVTGIDGHVLSARKAQIFHNTAIQMPLQASTSDSYITELYSTRGEWQTFRDRHGQALIPLHQTFYMRTKTYNISVAFTSQLEQYFRAPVWIEDFVDHSMHMFSDFRAVGVRAHIVIHKRDAATGVWQPHTDLVTESMNALEYAYDADVAVDPLVAWKERFTTLPGAKEIVDKAIRDQTKADVAL